MDIFGTKRRAAAAKARRAEWQYESAIDTAISDALITDEEAESLIATRQILGMSDAQGEKLYGRRAQELIEQRVIAALEDGMLSPHEDLAILDLAEALRIEPAYSGDIQNALRRARAVYGFVHNPMRAVPTELGLLAGEVAYYSAETQAFEQRTRTVSTSYAGPSVSIPIMRGVRYRIGNVSTTRHTEDFQYSFGIGATVITDRRLIFVGDRSLTISLTKILDIEAYRDGATITKTTGKPLTFVVSKDSDGFAILLTRAWNATRGVI